MSEENEIIVTKATIPPQKEWKAMGKPIMWVCEETDGEYEVQFDVGYGGMRLLHSGKEVIRGRNHIYWNGVLVMDKNIYGLPKYLWT